MVTPFPMSLKFGGTGTGTRTLFWLEVRTVRSLLTSFNAS